MSVDKKFLLRKSTGDQPIAAEAELREWLQTGQCKPADFLYDLSTQKWGRVGDHPALAPLFADKPGHPPDRRVIYFIAPGGSATAPQGPFSTKEIQQRAQLREICASTWVFVEGDKEWRQVRNVKILNEMLPALPSDAPPPVAAPGTPPPFSISIDAPPVRSPSRSADADEPSMPSITLDFGMGDATSGASATDSGMKASRPLSSAPSNDSDESHIEREEVTMALDMMGLNLHSEHISPSPLPPPPPKVAKPSIAPRPSAPPAPPKDANGFDGIEAEIPMDPIWLVKQANSETVSGPFRFLEVIKFLEEGRLTKNDKIARTGNKAFTKIQQQYEFNVKFSVESVIESGQEKQKILIRRRHPRVPYMTGVQIVSKHGLLAGQCMNISAGGILMEVAKAEFNLGEIIEVKILPGLIAKSISCKSLIIGKIPKIPPGYALKFEELKPEDKEAIEYYVQETLKREMLKKN